MSTFLAENSFEKGRAAVVHGQHMEGLAYFEAAMVLTRRAGIATPMKYLSYYGLCLAMGSDRVEDAREICEEALLHETADPDLYLNLGRVCLRAGDRAGAFETFVRGLRQSRRHRGLVEEMHRLGFRHRPALPFLRRRHPVNRILGRLRAGLRALGRPRHPSHHPLVRSV